MELHSLVGSVIVLQPQPCHRNVKLSTHICTYINLSEQVFFPTNSLF